MFLLRGFMSHLLIINGKVLGGGYQTPLSKTTHLSCVIKEMRACSGSISSTNSLASLSNYQSNDYLSMLGLRRRPAQEETGLSVKSLL